MSESNKGKKIISRSSEHNPVTHETKYTITSSDGSSDNGTFISNGKSLSGAATAASSSNSPKMKRQNTNTEEDTENKS
jgi:hypothetical protein